MSVCWPSSAIDNHIYIHNCREITVSRELYLHVERSQSTQKEPEKNWTETEACGYISDKIVGHIYKICTDHLKIFAYYAGICIFRDLATYSFGVQFTFTPP